MSGRERSQRVEGVVLRHNDWGEADRILVLYTLEMGKIRVIAKGVRKVRSRKAGHLEPFTRVALLLARGRDMQIVTQAETLGAYLGLREDFLKTTYAAHVVELLDRFTFEEGGKSSSIPAVGQRPRAPGSNSPTRNHRPLLPHPIVRFVGVSPSAIPMFCLF